MTQNTINKESSQAPIFQFNPNDTSRMYRYLAFLIGLENENVYIDIDHDGHSDSHYIRQELERRKRISTIVRVGNDTITIVTQDKFGMVDSWKDDVSEDRYYGTVEALKHALSDFSESDIEQMAYIVDLTDTQLIDSNRGEDVAGILELSAVLDFNGASKNNPVFILKRGQGIDEDSRAGVVLNVTGNFSDGEVIGKSGRSILSDRSIGKMTQCADRLEEEYKTTTMDNMSYMLTRSALSDLFFSVK